MTWHEVGAQSQSSSYRPLPSAFFFTPGPLTQVNPTTPSSLLFRQPPSGVPCLHLPQSHLAHGLPCRLPDTPFYQGIHLFSRLRWLSVALAFAPSSPAKR